MSNDFQDPNCYLISLHERSIFYFDVAIVVVIVRELAILQAVRIQTHFSSAASLKKQNSNTLQDTFSYIWTIPYLGVQYNL